MSNVIIAAAIAIVAAVSSTFGVNLQKHSHNIEKERARYRPYHRRPLWWVGMICVVFAAFGDFIALGFAPQTLVVSVGGGGTIFGNCIMSKMWLKQSLYLTDMLGVAMVSLGVLMLACTSQEEGRYKMEQIYQMMEAPPFIIYCFVTTVIVMTLLMRVGRSKAPALRAVQDAKGNLTTSKIQSVAHLERLSEVQEQPEGYSTTVPETSTVEDICTQPQTTYLSPFPSSIYGTQLRLSPRASCLLGEADDAETRNIFQIDSRETNSKMEGFVEKQSMIIDSKLPLYWAALSGTLGAQSVLLAKSVAEMIFSSINGDNQFHYFGTYGLIGGMLIMLLAQTHTLNLATMTGDTMSSYPVYQAFWISMSNISGVVFFQQAHRFSRLQLAMFPCAILLVLAGIFLISKHESFGNRVKYSVAIPISLGSPSQQSLVTQSFIFRIMTPQGCMHKPTEWQSGFAVHHIQPSDAESRA
uniref:Uncharacterized protein AlNc14C143G7324 n=1 Tax=Albugo laibachii Nc14 TaxID=890382 RepID=F0WLD6_9STRA|nr:conserved hypothetical protein [Albugo laibachii Nc14]|eukprot:CCA22099.1 conserved hypothetical protein [Albugo laibachii Nc14]